MKLRHLIGVIVLNLFLIPGTYAQLNKYPEITEQYCDARDPCPEGQGCYSFPDIGLRCAKPDPCSYYQCPEGTQCLIAQSYPGQIKCSCIGPDCPNLIDGEDTVSHDALTQATPIVEADEEIVSHNISDTSGKSYSKTCGTNSDCVFKAGCYCGCYNEDFESAKLEIMFCSCESSDRQYPECECINSQCQPVSNK